MKRLLPLVLIGLTAAAAQGQTEMHVLPLFADNDHPLTILVEGTGCPLAYMRSEVRGRRLIVKAFTPRTLAPCANEPWAFEAGFGRLAAGRYVVELMVDDIPLLKRAKVVRPSGASFLYLDPGPVAGPTTFGVTIQWSLPGEDTPRFARSIQTSPMAGYFWFFSPDNPEAMVKIIDGSGINGRAWLYISSLTTLPFSVTLSHCDSGDPPTCKFREYQYPGGRDRLILDFELE
jgi:hypothetical protein